jgi:tetratricopeptide (TPR) repeat protein
LDAKFNTEQIRKRLKKLSLKATGSKQQLLQEWVRNDAEGAKRAIGDFYLFEVTELGWRNIELTFSSQATLDSETKFSKQVIVRSLKYILDRAASGILGNRVDAIFVKVLEVLISAILAKKLLTVSEHPDVATSLDHQGKYSETITLAKGALDIIENAKTYGLHPAELCRTFAEYYRSLGNYRKAEPLYQQALAIIEKTRGPEHPDVAAVLEDYAALLRATGRDAEAEKLELRASAIRKK